jgi:pimeloyl-ACP methyl ester carboxylesterase
VPIRKLAVYEAPFIVDAGRTPIPDDFLDNLRATIAADRRGEAVKQFMRLVQAPGFMIAIMPLMPVWSKLKAVAPTLAYDISFMEQFQRGRPLPRGRWSGVTAPTLVIDGGKSPAWMRSGNRALADALPASSYKTLPGQTHMVKIPVLAPVLAEFFAS